VAVPLSEMFTPHPQAAVRHQGGSGPDTESAEDSVTCRKTHLKISMPTSCPPESYSDVINLPQLVTPSF
jgi:hypothetical protein